MGALRGAVVGSLTLVIFYDVIQAPAAGITTLASLPARLAHYVVSPDVPLIPNIALSATIVGPLSTSGAVTPPSSKTAPAQPSAPDQTSALTALSN